MNIEKAKYLKEKIIGEFHEGLYYRYDTDNTILFTAEFYYLCKLLGIFTKEDAQRFCTAIVHLQARDEDGSTVPGLYHRNIGRKEKLEQWDNYDAIACSVMFGITVFAEDIINYGNLFFIPSYDNRSPYEFSKHKFLKHPIRYFEACRQGWQLFTYRVCAEKYPGIINTIWYIGKILFESKTYVSDHILSIYRHEVIGYKWYLKPFIYLWKKRLMKIHKVDTYEELIAKVYKIYHKKETITLLAECLV